MRQQHFFFSDFRFFSALSFIAVIFGCVLLLFPSSSHGAYIVDTGAGRTDVSGGIGLGRRCDAVAACSSSWLAGKFSIDNDVRVHSVEGWIGVSRFGSGGPANAVLYADGEGGRVPGDILYSGEFLVPDVTGEIEVRWRGLFGQNWLLNSGTYWVGFEVYPYNDRRSLAGFMPGRGVSNPLERYAAISGPTNIGAEWQRCCELSTESLGFRVDATAVVPIPPAAGLFCFSLFGLSFGRFIGSVGVNSSGSHQSSVRATASSRCE